MLVHLSTERLGPVVRPSESLTREGLGHGTKSHLEHAGVACADAIYAAPRRLPQSRRRRRRNRLLSRGDRHFRRSLRSGREKRQRAVRGHQSEPGPLLAAWHLLWWQRDDDL